MSQKQTNTRDEGRIRTLPTPNPPTRPITACLPACLCGCLSAADYFVWGIDLRQGEFTVETYGDRYLKQGQAMFDFARKHGYFN